VHKLVKDFWLPALIGLGVLVALVVYPIWRKAVDTNRDARADPHHIAGNLYFVGAPDVTSFLLTGPDGDILIDGGDENTAHKIIDNIAQLGFDIKNVRILLASGAGLDQAGGLAELQRASHAELWSSDENAGVIASGGRQDPSKIEFEDRFATWVGATSYPAARVDHRIKDGQVVRLGPIAVTAHLAPGCTAWTFTVQERGSSTPLGSARDLRVVHRCSLTVPSLGMLADPEIAPGVRADFEQRNSMLRSLPVDIWISSHGRDYGRFRKFEASLSAEDKTAPFIDPEGYRKSIDDADAKLRTLLAEQKANGKS
jgi:metallo-beta-lactamase class B